MTLTTEIVAYRRWGRKDLNKHAEWLLDEIRAFAEIPTNSAFWRESKGHCIVVQGAFDDFWDGVHIKCAEIEKEVRGWCRSVAEWCHEDPDENDGSEEFARKTLRVEISDCDADGGLRVKCFSKDDRNEAELLILPIRTKEAGDGK